MAETELNLEGRTEREVRGTATPKKPWQKGGGGGSSAARGQPTVAQIQKLEQELKSRIEEVLVKIADVLEARDDEELATVLREDAEAMGQGLMSLTARLKFLRSPLLMILAFVEPTLAFGRVVRILLTRWRARGRRQAEPEPINAEDLIVHAAA